MVNLAELFQVFQIKFIRKGHFLVKIFDVYPVTGRKNNQTTDTA